MRISDWSSDVCSSDLDHALGDVENDHHRECVVVGALELELLAQIDDRHDGAAQIDHALDEVRRVGNARDGVVTADLLDFENDRKSVVEGKSVSVRVDPGGRRIIKQQKV